MTASGEILEVSRLDVTFAVKSSETQSTMLHQPSGLLAQARPTLYARALPARLFLPANPSLLGFIDEPKGRPLCSGGYSDVWRCDVRFSTPSKELPTEVSLCMIVMPRTSKKTNKQTNLNHAD